MEHLCCSEVSISPLFRWPNSVCHYRITVETWSITTDKKALYSKVMNIPGMQQLTSTKSFVGDVVGTCNQ
ncbi:hypothetical protein E4532_05220 [Escherichia coli]|nr:hypothetical protein [Escherichia coli]